MYTVVMEGLSRAEGGCGAEVKCGSAKYLGLLEPDMHWNSHTMFLHLLELII